MPPDAMTGSFVVFQVTSDEDAEAFLPKVRALAAAVGVPVQALRADRVLSGTHVLMAVRHARRAQAAGRMRASDPAVEFLLYAAGDRQIHRAVEALGLPPGPVGEVVLVVLGPVDAEAARAAVTASWRGAAVAPWHGPLHAARAASWWRERLTGAGPLEDALLARMALLSLDKP